jgi:hypothetical protein
MSHSVAIAAGSLSHCDMSLRLNAAKMSPGHGPTPGSQRPPQPGCLPKSPRHGFYHFQSIQTVTVGLGSVSWSRIDVMCWSPSCSCPKPQHHDWSSVTWRASKFTRTNASVLRRMPFDLRTCTQSLTKYSYDNKKENMIFLISFLKVFLGLRAQWATGNRPTISDF